MMQLLGGGCLGACWAVQNAFRDEQFLKPYPSAELQLQEARPAEPDSTKRGVTYAYLRAFANALPQDITIHQVVETIIRPHTAKTHCCYYDIVPEAGTGTPGFFISHTWSRTLADLVNRLENFFTEDPEDYRFDEEGPVIWLDIFAINQHGYEDNGQLKNDDVDRLQDNISATGATLLSLDPEGWALTRIWCLYEVWQTIELKGENSLLCLVNSHRVNSMPALILGIDVSTAQATQPADRERILAQIMAKGGCLKVTEAIIRALAKAAVKDAAVADKNRNQWHHHDSHWVNQMTKAGHCLVSGVCAIQMRRLEAAAGRDGVTPPADVAGTLSVMRSFFAAALVMQQFLEGINRMLAAKPMLSNVIAPLDGDLLESHWQQSVGFARLTAMRRGASSAWAAEEAAAMSTAAAPARASAANPSQTLASLVAGLNSPAGYSQQDFAIAVMDAFAQMHAANDHAGHLLIPVIAASSMLMRCMRGMASSGKAKARVALSVVRQIAGIGTSLGLERHLAAAKAQEQYQQHMNAYTADVAATGMEIQL